MEISKSLASKILKKQKRCQFMIKSDTGIECNNVESEVNDNKDILYDVGNPNLFVIPIEFGDLQCRSLDWPSC